MLHRRVLARARAVAAALALGAVLGSGLVALPAVAADDAVEATATAAGGVEVSAEATEGATPGASPSSTPVPTASAPEAVAAPVPAATPTDALPAAPTEAVTSDASEDAQENAGENDAESISTADADADATPVERSGATSEAAESVEQTDALDAAPLAASPMALLSAEDPGCHYANASGGQYANALCWLDLSYVTSDGEKKPITTEWVQTAAQTTTTITRSQFTNDAICPSAYRTSTNGREYRRTTITYASVLGAAYGSKEFSGCARSGSASTAMNDSATQANNNLNANLYQSGGVRYGNVTNYPISFALSGGSYTFNAMLSVTAPAASAASAVRAAGFPTWSGAYLGNSIYEMPAGIRSSVFPALYQLAGGTTTATLSGIRVTRDGTNFAGYSIVVADAESTDNGESISWTQAGGQGFRWLPNNPTAFTSATSNADRKSAAVGNACAGTTTSQWPGLTPPTSPVTCSAGSSQPSPKTGTAMLQALPPTDGAGFSVTQAMTGGGLQAVAFGLLMARATVTVNVADRVVDASGVATSGSFSASMSHPGGTVSAQTGATGSTGTQALELPVDASGTQLNFTTSTAAPSASSYTVGWVCTQSGASGSSRWPETGSSPTPPATNIPWFLLQAGQFIDCVVTYTPPYLTLVKTVDNGETGASNVPTDFTLRAAGGASAIAGAAQSQGVTRRAVATGSYALTETGPAGYDWTNVVCTAAVTKSPTSGPIASASLTVDKGQDITCTYTNTARSGTITWTKTDADTGALLGGSEWSLVGPSGASSASLSVVDNTGQAGYTGRDTDPTAGRFSVTGLRWGAYMLTESKPPAGYIAAAVTIPSVSVGGSTTTADAGTITNTRILTFGVAKYRYPIGQGTPLSGSEFAVLTDVDGQPGGGASGAAVTPVASNPGTFTVTGLRRGFYWLQETKAPAGHELLAQPVRFRVLYDSANPTPVLELVGGTQAFVALSSDKQTINVSDVPSLILPLTGGAGTGIFTVGGAFLLGFALLLSLWWRRRRHARHMPPGNEDGAP